MSEYYNRYQAFGDTTNKSVVPFVEIPKTDSDLEIIYQKSRMRLDMLSYKYYGDPNYGWLIMLANPKYGFYEYLIPDGVNYRIPYPLSSAVLRYESVASNATK